MEPLRPRAMVSLTVLTLVLGLVSRIHAFHFHQNHQPFVNPHNHPRHVSTSWPFTGHDRQKRRDLQQTGVIQSLAATWNVSATRTWATSSNCSQWAGVTCDGSGNVLSISLTNARLTGPVPQALFSLNTLQSLNLSRNFLEGSVSGISALNGLTSLDLTSNNLNGTLSDFTSLRNLRFLSVAFNKYWDSIPSGVSALSALNSLMLSNNLLTGPLPSSLGALRNLRELLLGNNQLSGGIPAALANCTGLQALDLSDNLLTGGVPADLTSLPRLMLLDLSKNMLVGPAPVTFASPSMGNTAQASLRLSSNYFSGSPLTKAAGVPFCPSSLQGLYSISLSFYGTDRTSFISQGNNCFNSSASWNFSVPGGNCSLEAQQRSPSACMAFCNAASPQGLSSICGGRGTCSIPATPAGSSPVCTCNSGFAAISIRGSWTTYSSCGPVVLVSRFQASALLLLASNWSLSANLATWNSSANCSTWAGVTCDSLGNVVELTISGSSIGLPIPAPPFANLTSLRSLILSNNGITGAFPLSLLQLRNLTSLDLSGNNFTGALPTLAASLSLAPLRSLVAVGSGITGGIPDTWSRLSGLTNLALTGNSLSGSIPSNVSVLTALVHLMLGNNRLTGSIPSALGNCRSLLAIDLSSNLLWGSVPSSLINLPSLIFLDLSSNYLSGTAPVAFASAALRNMADASYNIQSNYFSGSPVVTAAGVPFCPASLQGGYARTFLAGTRARSFTTGSTAVNCFNASVAWWPAPNDTTNATASCILGNQPRDRCLLFCNANRPCNNLGTCTVNSTGQPQCSCNAGAFPYPGGLGTSFPFPTCTSNANLAARVAASQLPAMASLASSLSGGTATLTWSSTNQCGLWTGVTCDAQGNVVSISLSNQGISPTQLPRRKLLVASSQSPTASVIPEAISALVFLRSLSLPSNFLTGQIPSNISTLTALTILDLTNNQLTGAAPTTLSRLANLQFLSLAGNSLSGPFPSSISSLTQLTTLSLAGNRFSGSIVAGVGRLVQLMNLLLGNCGISGQVPSSLGNLTNLLALDLGSNSLIGTVHPFIASLPKLIHLDLSNNQLTGQAPVSLVSRGFQNSSQASLRLFNNYFIGSPVTTSAGVPICPQTLLGGYARTLSTFGVSATSTSALRMNCFNSSVSWPWDGSLDPSGNGTVPSGVCPVDPGQKTPVSCVAFCNAPSPSGACSGLGTCFLTPATDPPSPTCQCNPNLFNVVLRQNNVAYPSCANYSQNITVNPTQASALQGIALSWGGPDPTQTWSRGANCSLWGGVTCDARGNVIALSLPNRDISSSLPNSSLFTPLSALQSLNLANSGLTGPVPLALFQLPSLTFLDLSLNQLSGVIPNVTSRLAPLRHLNLAGNSLEGAIPASLSLLSNLTSLSLASNSLSGSIPPSLGNFPSLRNLVLNTNALTGQIPASLGNLLSLAALDLGSNLLWGTVPTSLPSLPNLVFFDVSRNLLSGAPPLNFSSPLMSNTANASLAVFANFFTGSPVAYAKGIPVCPSSLRNHGYFRAVLSPLRPSRALTSAVSGNCFDNRLPWYPPPADVSNATANCSIGAQESSTTCRSFCNVLDPLGPCAGLGTCSVTDAGTPVCVCRAGAFTYVGANSAFSTCTTDATLATSMAPADAAVLQALATQLPGSSTATWQLSRQCGLWDGVTCNAQGNVVGISLVGQGAADLNSTIPPSLASLRSLQTLALVSCSLTDSIPANFSLFTSLTSLDLTGNNLAGNVPDLSNIASRLQYLSLANNLLSGSFPAKLLVNRALTTLALSQNLFDRSLPTSLGNSFPSLRNLLLATNSFTGSIPNSLSLVSALVVLDLSGNKLVGSVPAPILTLRNLTVFDVGNNNLSGRAPVNFTSPFIGTSTGTYNIANNFFSGSPVTYSAGVPFCYAALRSGHVAANLKGLKTVSPARRGVPTGGGGQFSNCFPLTNPNPPPLQWWPAPGDTQNVTGNCTLEKQLPTSQCFSFCNASSPVGPCAGVGSCIVDSSGTPVCTCPANWSSLIPPPPSLVQSGVSLTSTCTQNLGLAVLVAASQIPAMQAIKDQFPANSAVATWQPTFQCAYWSGVTCNARGMITSIDLFGQFAGPASGESPVLPPSISLLTDLVRLDLANAGLQGVVPLNLTVLTALTALDLTANSFSGPIPNLSPLRSLRFLSLSANQFTGVIPTSLSANTALTALILSNNLLQGSIPAIVLSSLRQLQWLILGGNALNGTIPATAGNLTELVALDLSNNYLYGTVPPGITSPRNLVFISLYGNQLTGQPPTNFSSAALGSPQGSYRMGYNYFTGSPVPTAAGVAFCPRNQQGLYVVQSGLSAYLSPLSNGLQYNCFNDTGRWWSAYNDAAAAANTPGCALERQRGWLECMEFCNVLAPSGACAGAGTCYIDTNGTVPAVGTSRGKATCLCNSRYPYTIDTKTRWTSGYIVAHSSCSDDASLVAKVNPAQQAVMAAIASLWPPEVTFTWVPQNLCLQWNGVYCDGQGNVVSLTLKSLDLASIPDAVSNLTALRSLSLRFCKLAGEIPNGISRLTSLTFIDLTGNALSGSPPPLQPLSRLVFLSLASNSLTGPIPSNVSRLTNLTTLSLASNRFNGTIPASLSSLTNMVHLLLAKNLLTGIIPPKLGDLTRLAAIDLSFNALYGPVPASILLLPRLVFFTVNNNQLSGPAPTAFASSAIGSQINGTLNIGNNYFTGSPVPTAKGVPFCPVNQQGAYASANLLQLASGRYGSQRGNCFDSAPDWWAQYNEAVAAIAAAAAANSTGQTAAADAAAAPASSSFTGADNNNRTASILNIGSETLAAYRSAMAAFAACTLEFQKSLSQCTGFCNVYDPLGPCQGLGNCKAPERDGSSPFRQPFCECKNSSLVPVLVRINSTTGARVTVGTCVNASLAPPPPPPPRTTNTNLTGNFSTGFSFGVNGQVPTAYMNRYFRYASLGFAGTYDNPYWVFANATDWRSRPNSPWNFVAPVKSQGACGACWAFAPVAAAASALAIAYNYAAPNISEQQLIDCQGTWQCGGGWPADALNYMANPMTPGLRTSTQYPYTGVSGTCKFLTPTGRRLNARDLQSSSVRPPPPSTGASPPPRVALQATSPPPPVPPALLGPYKVSMYEEIDFNGWFGMMLAVQVQPIVANLEGDHPSFVSYSGGYAYDDPACWAKQMVTHTVTIIGYDLTSTLPYWIIQNSWGPQWGDGGYGWISIRGGDGTCGIQSTPALYPLVKGPNACNPNPCGGGLCSLNSTTGLNKCSCPDNFVAVTNLDGTQSCSPLRVCVFFATNPCGVGTCVDDMAGSYNCICPMGFVNATRTDGTPSCVPGNTPQTVVVSQGMTCDLIRGLYGLNITQFLTLNPTLDPSRCDNLTVGQTLVVANSNYPGCELAYTISSNDTCESAAATFTVPTSQILNNNPDLNCSDLNPGQQICIYVGTPQEYLCQEYYQVQPGDTCEYVYKYVAQPPLSPALFYAFNPGIMCSNLVPLLPANPSAQAVAAVSTLPGPQVCIQAIPQVLGARCPWGTYTCLKGDSCAVVFRKVYFSSSVLFTSANGWACVNTKLTIGRVLCRPNPATKKK